MVADSATFPCSLSWVVLGVDKKIFEVVKTNFDFTSWKMDSNSGVKIRAPQLSPLVNYLRFQKTQNITIFHGSVECSGLKIYFLYFTYKCLLYCPFVVNLILFYCIEYLSMRSGIEVKF